MGKEIKVVALQNTLFTRQGEVWTFDDEKHDFLRCGEKQLPISEISDFDKWFWILRDSKEIRLTDTAVLAVTSKGITLRAKGRKPKNLNVVKLAHEVYFAKTQTFKPRVVLMDFVEFRFELLEEALTLYENLKLTGTQK